MGSPFGAMPPGPQEGQGEPQEARADHHHVQASVVRDVQRAEMKVGLGPAKGKDFASSLGPTIVTSEALADRSVNRPGVYDLSMSAKINGVEMSRGNFKDIFWSFGEIIARASDTCELQPGDVIGSGTVGTGCLLELTKTQGPWLNEGDVVELEIERIGILRNIIGGKKK